MLTAETVYARYLGYLGLSTRTAHERLTRVTFNDYDREIALVAVDTDETGEPVVVAVGRLSKSHAAPDGEFAILVADAWQRRGLGTELLRRLVQIACDEKLELIWAEMLITNEAMRRTAVAAGFTIMSADGGTMRAELRLEPQPQP
jgi:acetyltransferase